MFFRLGSSRAALLGLNKLFLTFLFVGFVRSIFYLFINKVTVFQPPLIFFEEDPRPNYVISSLCSIALFHNFTPLSGFLFIYSPMPSHGLKHKII